MNRVVAGCLYEQATIKVRYAKWIVFLLVSLCICFCYLGSASKVYADDYSSSDGWTNAWLSHANWPSVNSDQTRIHVLSFTRMDAILLESNGHFALVDSGEDSTYPDGSNSLYPLRSGITIGHGREQQVIAYLKYLGVTEDNFDFYLGTHPHSDHIGSASQIIYEFKPKRVYTPQYRDSYMSQDPDRFDNQYCYDRLVQAAYDVDATLITTLDPSETSTPSSKGQEETASPFFSLGAMSIQVVNYDTYYRYTPVPDANFFSWGVKVSAYGSSAFLAGDIINYEGDEDRITKEVGKVDFLKVGHHANGMSCTYNFIQTMRPQYAVITNNYRFFDSDTIKNISGAGSKIYFAGDADSNGYPAMIATFTNQGMSVNIADTQDEFRWRTSSPSMTHWYNHQPTTIQGWKSVEGYWYYFDKSPYALQSAWKKIDGDYYYFKSDATMATGWVQSSGVWYYLNPSGVMQTGWKSIDGYWYYLEPSGAMVSSTIRDGYYLDSSGRMVTNNWVDETTYADASGKLTTYDRGGSGWKSDSTGWYFENPDGSYPAAKWRLISAQWYYFDARGYMVVGWMQQGRSWYHFDSSGAMQTDWQSIDGSWYYFMSSGYMSKGWTRIDENWYLLDGSGAMQTGWVEQGGQWYYLEPSGVMAKGISTIDAHVYYFEENGIYQSQIS